MLSMYRITYFIKNIFKLCIFLGIFFWFIFFVLYFLVYVFLSRLTSNDSMRWHSCIKRFVPRILIFTDRSNFSSNLTVAAEWNTMDTVRHNIFCKKKETILVKFVTKHSIFVISRQILSLPGHSPIYRALRMLCHRRLGSLCWVPSVCLVLFYRRAMEMNF